MTEDPRSARTRGRPRSQRVEQAILDATIAEFAERGFGSLTIEAVAARAGVAKTTIYRRWNNKDALCLAALKQAKGLVGDPPGESLRGDLIDLLTRVYRNLWDSDFGRLIPHLAAEARRYPDMAQRYWNEHVTIYRGPAYRVLRRAVADGTVRDDIDLELVVEMLYGSANIRALWRINELSDAQIEQTVDLVLAAISR